MEGVVMDGSAVGILGSLPRFERLVSLVEPVTRSADKQYIMKNAKSRKFVECMMMRGRKCCRRGNFEVYLTSSLWLNTACLMNRFLCWSQSEMQEAKVISQFITSSFELQNSNEEANTENEGSGS